MSRASRICSHPGCPNLQPCPVHQRKPWAGSTRRQQLPRGWGRLRRLVLRRDPVCRICGVAPSTEVDHIRRGNDHSLDNLRGVCGPCHKEKTQREAADARG